MCARARPLAAVNVRTGPEFVPVDDLPGITAVAAADHPSEDGWSFRDDVDDD
jgi:hypothetical protein